MKVSEVSLGAWLTFGGSVDEQKSIDIIYHALDNGINFIDIADVYSGGKAEQVVGKALAEGQYKRKDLVISSKVFWPMSDNVNDYGLSRKHIMDSIDGTLDRLGLDYIDIYYCHRYDWRTPLEETIQTMDSLIRDGRVRYWGTSVWSAAQLERAIGIAKEYGYIPPAVEQPRYNMLDRYIEEEVMYTAKYHGIGITPWSPLEQGILTGKYNEGIPPGSRADQREFLRERLTPDVIEKVKQLTELASSLDISMAQLALAWILRREEISSVITGATSKEQVDSNIKASGVELSKQTLEQIEDILGNKPQGHPIYQPALMDRP